MAVLVPGVSLAYSLLSIRCRQTVKSLYDLDHPAGRADGRALIIYSVDWLRFDGIVLGNLTPGAQAGFDLQAPVLFFRGPDCPGFVRWHVFSWLVDVARPAQHVKTVLQSSA